MATTIIIPARNEAATIGPIVEAFKTSICKCEVFVGIDDKTIDNTADIAREAGAHAVIRTTKRGKGQVVWQTLTAAAMVTHISRRIVLCDADYTGLTRDHVYKIIESYRNRDGMVLGIPDWPEMDLPGHVITSWPHVTGFRCLPFGLIPPDAHGYLLETQINVAAVKLNVPIHRVYMNGLHSPFEWPLSAERNDARLADREWGIEHGILE